MYLNPSEIRFSQDSIACTFSIGSHRGRPIGETLDELLLGRCTDDDIPMMTVTSRNGHWYTGDNRRLWVFRKAEELGIIDYQIEVKKGWVHPDKFTTDNQGVSIEIRGNPGGRAWRKRRRIKKTNTPDPSPTKIVKPSVSDYNLPSVRAESIREDKPVVLNNVPVDNRYLESKKCNDYITNTTKDNNKLSLDQLSIGKADGSSRTGISSESYDNPTFVRGKDVDIPSSDVNIPYTTDTDVGNVIVTVSSLPGFARDTVQEPPGGTTTTGTTALDVEAGETVRNRRCSGPTSRNCVIEIVVGIVVVQAIIISLLVVLANVS